MGQTVNLSSSDRLGALPSGRTFDVSMMEIENK
uniref:Uncharacterized protein n=1 Tax=Siphoviridae sp. ctEkS11 TaxID=2827272 RepID=A0A8S5R4M6_9CAUD|nr:MAG TPA: hypothetical protein [Siphoviridae sp. ctEkS11]DAV77169.1 MAG TPA: hypothetical protein [Caudoviricetes sp.]